jgi:hypothetical protein
MAGTEELSRLRRFGFSVGTAFAAAAVVFAWQQVPRASAALAALGGYLLFWAAVSPGMLRSFEWAWLGAGRAARWIYTRAAQGLIYLVRAARRGLRLPRRGEPAQGLVPQESQSFERRY